MFFDSSVAYFNLPSYSTTSYPTSKHPGAQGDSILTYKEVVVVVSKLVVYSLVGNIFLDEIY